MAARDPQQSDLIEPRLAPEPWWRWGTARSRRRLALGLYLLLGLTLAGAGVRALVQDAENQVQAGRVGLEARAFVPFDGGPWGWSGLLELRNVGTRPVSVLGFGLPRPAVLLGLHGVPLRIDSRSSGLVQIRLRLDCSADAAAGRRRRT